MKVINRQTFSIAKHLESGREADGSQRQKLPRPRLCSCKQEKMRPKQNSRDRRQRKPSLKSCKSPRKVHMSLSALMKSSEFHSDVPGRVLSSLSQHSKLPVCPPFSFLSSAAFT